MSSIEPVAGRPWWLEQPAEALLAAGARVDRQARPLPIHDGACQLIGFAETLRCQKPGVEPVRGPLRQSNTAAWAVNAEILAVEARQGNELRLRFALGRIGPTSRTSTRSALPWPRRRFKFSGSVAFNFISVFSAGKIWPGDDRSPSSSASRPSPPDRRTSKSLTPRAGWRRSPRHAASQDDICALP